MFTYLRIVVDSRAVFVVGPVMGNRSVLAGVLFSNIISWR